MKKNTASKSKGIRPVIMVLAIALLGSSFIAQGSVANDAMRNLSRGQYVKNMYLGWNLGNTMDANTETGWGQPVTTQAMIDAVHKQGFKTMREPVTWNGHFGGSPTYTIDATWMARVAAIANYALNDSMYVMINTHHDGWYNLSSTSPTVQAEVVAIWTQIANAFKSYSDYVSFEIFNEPNAGATNQYGGGSDANRAALAAYQTAAIAAIRATGGNNHQNDHCAGYFRLTDTSLHSHDTYSRRQYHGLDAHLRPGRVLPERKRYMGFDRRFAKYSQESH